MDVRDGQKRQASHVHDQVTVGGRPGGSALLSSDRIVAVGYAVPDGPISPLCTRESFYR